jgi:histidinol-phosphate aminotransferase
MNPALSKLIRRHYITLQGYVSAGMEVKKDDSTVFMNANENPFALPGLEGFNRYPEPQPVKLLEAYAGLYGVTPENIAMTRGGDEAIWVLTRLFCEPHEDSILIHPPTYGMYPVDARSMPAGVVEVPLLKTNESFALDVEGMISTAKEPDVKLVFICSPNNPTGNSFPHADIERICRETVDEAVVVLDETYAEFSTQGSLVPKLKDYPNLVILRTLSKSYSLAGMRMGTLLSADTDFIKFVRSKCLDAYPIPKASVDVGLKAMAPAVIAIAHKNIQILLQERDRLMAAFRANPITVRVYPSDTNYFLVELKDAKGFWDYCRKNKFILRDFSTKPLTENCLRISAGTPEQNDRLLELLKEYKKEI